MLFNSVEFVLFLPLVFALYWFSSRDFVALIRPRRLLAGVSGMVAGNEDAYLGHRSLRFQNILLLAASYVFYGWWDWRFLSLIIISSALDFWVGQRLAAAVEEGPRKQWLALSMCFNLGLLGFFKYYNFFVASFVAAFAGIGVELQASTLSIILPVGISFYTFQTMSYTLDIYRRQLEPTRDPVTFFAFVSFFPQLVAGPIERASNLLPQFEKQRKFDFDRARDGGRQILWGLFKKVVIADNCAIYVDQIFGQEEHLRGTVLVLGAVYFCFQVYCDFSGYSDIAIGTARLFGFDLMTNFRYPFFSTSVGEFWTRWHISLNTWFADYVYKPMAMGFRNWGTWAIPLAIFFTFALSGLWHGANYTYIMWGIVMGTGVMVETLTRKRRKKLRKKVGLKAWDFMGWVATVSFFAFSMIWFRSDSVTGAHQYIAHIFSSELFALPQPLSLAKFAPAILLLIAFEWLQRQHVHPLVLDRFPRPVRWLAYYCLLYMISNFGVTNQSFIYFQF